jgi:hypothetical protein
MERVYCQHCDKQLEVCEMMVPSYDDGGSVDAFDVEEYVHDCLCEGACKERDEMFLLLTFSGGLPL